MSRLPILMYHNVCCDEKDSVKLTISTTKLEEQFKYFYKNNYTTLHFSELENRKLIPKKSVIVTFDDVTENQFIYALPLLKKYNLKATFFIPFFYVGKTDLWDTGSKKIMTFSQLHDTYSDLVEFGYHSYKHQNYKQLSDEEITLDFEECKKTIQDNNLKVYPALAYPYGSFPRKKNEKEKFITNLVSNGMSFGLRIGNRPNKFPLKNKFEIQRIDVNGEDSLIKFKYKLKFNHLLKL